MYNSVLGLLHALSRKPTSPNIHQSWRSLLDGPSLHNQARYWHMGITCPPQFFDWMDNKMVCLYHTCHHRNNKVWMMRFSGCFFAFSITNWITSFTLTLSVFLPSSEDYSSQALPDEFQASVHEAQERPSWKEKDLWLIVQPNLQPV